MTRKKSNPRPTSAKTVRRTRYVTKKNTAKFKYKVKGSRGAVYKTTTLKEARKMAGKTGTITKIGGKKRNPTLKWKTTIDEGVVARPGWGITHAVFEDDGRWYWSVSEYDAYMGDDIRIESGYFSTKQAAKDAAAKWKMPRQRNP